MFVDPVRLNYEYDVTSGRRRLGRVQINPLGIGWRPEGKQKFRNLPWAEFEKFMKAKFGD